jgi:hypothetical protein
MCPDGLGRAFLQHLHLAIFDIDTQLSWLFLGYVHIMRKPNMAVAAPSS